MCQKQILSGVCVLLLVCGTVSAALDGLVAHWTFDEGSGATLGDSSENMNDGILQGGPVWVEGQIKGALSFNGSSDYVEIQNSASFDSITEQVTLCAWIKVNNFINWAGVVGKGTGSPSPWNMQIWGDGSLRTFPNWNSGPGPGATNSNGKMSTDVWTHGAITYDGSTVRLYINGEEDHAVNNAFTFQPSSQNTHIGVDFPGGDEYFDGSIDDVWVFNRALSAEEVAMVMAGISDTTASNPSPKDAADDIPRNVVLSWDPTESAATHNVYLGTAFEEVDSATEASPLLLSAGQSATSLDLGRLDFGQTIYWRVDEVNDAPDHTVFKGEVWSFTVEPFSYPVTPIAATASSSHAVDMGPDRTIDGSGLNELDQHSVDGTHMWLSGPGIGPAWIQYEFDKVYKLDKLWVWNSNQVIESFMGLGAKDVVIETSVDGTDWVQLADVAPFAQATGSPDYTANIVVDFAGTLAQFVRLTISSGYGFMPQYGLSELRFFYIPTFAREPEPVDGSTTASADVALAWRAGREAASHQVLLGTSADALALVDTTTEASTDLTALDLATTYFWQVKEVNDAEDPASHTGPVWSFTTPAYGIVDSFDRYDDDCNRIFFAWLDGLGHNGGEDIDDCAVAPYNGNGTGSIVGNAISPFAEKTIVHSGSQSMPLAYDSGVSEATIALNAQDWTASGVQSLSLYFHGAPGNTGQLYVKINNTKVAYDGSPDDLQRTVWTPWNIALSGVAVNLQAVTSLTIGIEGASAQGMIYVDDLRLYPRLGEIITPVMPDTANLVAYYPLDGDYQDASGNNRHGTAIAVADGPIFEPGMTGQALNFNVSGQYVEITGYQGIAADRTDPDNPAQNPFTVACWINTTDNGSLICWGSSDGAPVGGQYQNFRVDGGRLRAEHGDGRFRGAATVTDGEWHHVALAVDAGNMYPPATRVYVDGAQDAEGADTVNAQNIWNITADADVTIGSRASHGDRFFLGSIDDVRIYDRALSPEEIGGLAGRTGLIHKPL